MWEGIYPTGEFKGEFFFPCLAYQHRVFFLQKAKQNKLTNIHQSHQNKFHAATLRTLTQKFSQIGENGPANPADRALWEYFADLYKNSNKGIKGRGKDRRISTKRSAQRDSMERVSVESDESVKMRRGSYDGFSVYGSSSDGDEEGYYIGRRQEHEQELKHEHGHGRGGQGHGHGHGHAH
jgi:ribosomal protein S20